MASRAAPEIRTVRKEGGRGSLHPWRSLPNQLTITRLALLPVLWFLALSGLTTALAAVLAVAGLTDLLDGAVARRTRRTTRAGAQLDSVADHLLSASVLAWLALLRPGFVRAELPLLTGWLTLGVAALAAGWVRHRRLGNLHLYSAKVAGLAGYLFALALLITPSYDRRVFHVVIGLCFLASAESLLLVLTRRTVDEGDRSILLARRDGDRGGRRT